MPEEASRVASPGRCPRCGAALASTLACLACAAVLPEPPGSQAFARLGVPPVEPVDLESAERNYLQLSRVLHPDRQTGADDETRARALGHSALLNEAWTIVSDPQLRAEAMVELHDPGALERHKQLSPAFLMEALELSEELEEARATGCQATIRRIADTAQRELDERMQHVSSACGRTIQRIARQGYVAPKEAPGAVRLLSPHDWDTEQIAILLHQARVYRRILRDTEAPTP